MIFFLNNHFAEKTINRDIVIFMESCCGQNAVIQNEANREAVEKNRSNTLNKVNIE